MHHSPPHTHTQLSTRSCTWTCPWSRTATHWACPEHRWPTWTDPSSTYLNLPNERVERWVTTDGAMYVRQRQVHLPSKPRPAQRAATEPRLTHSLRTTHTTPSAYTAEAAEAGSRLSSSGAMNAIVPSLHRALHCALHGHDRAGGLRQPEVRHHSTAAGQENHVGTLHVSV